METADGVAVGGGAECQHGHGETLVAVETIAAPQGHELLEIDTHFGAVLGEVVVHHAGVEQVDTGRDRSMGGENVAGAGGFQRLVEIKLAVAHVEPNLFQGEEGGVAFVHVEHSGLEPHGLQGAHAADTKDDFLADPGVDIAAIKGIGDVAILRQHVVGNVGVQQVQGDTADAQFPDLNEHAAGGQFDRHLEIVAVGVLHGFQRQRVKVVHGIAFLLPSVGIQKLAEIALLVEQPQAD